jgi:SEC-C motif-containing protein
VPAATAEQLMRSRYSAFAVGDDAYLLRTWHPSTRPRRVRFDPGRRWVRLEVLHTQRGDLLDSEGTVEFVAHHQLGDDRRELYEVSTFVRDDGHWRYLGPVDASLE